MTIYCKGFAASRFALAVGHRLNGRRRLLTPARIVVAAALLLLLAGCSAKSPPKFDQGRTIAFRGCTIVEKSDGKAGCLCAHPVWLVDAKTGGWVVSCDGGNVGQ
jgi:hypothetical protein